MISSFPALFGCDHQVDDMYLPLFANDVRQAGQVTAEQQHRWLLMGRALQEKANQSVLMSSSALLDFLDWMCDPVEHLLNDVFEGNAQIFHAS
jgi:hypothetical protein